MAGGVALSFPMNDFSQTDLEEIAPMSNTALEQLTPQNSVLLFIDHQPQMAFGVADIDRQTLNNHYGRNGKFQRLHPVFQPRFQSSLAVSFFSMR